MFFFRSRAVRRCESSRATFGRDNKTHDTRNAKHLCEINVHIKPKLLVAAATPGISERNCDDDDGIIWIDPQTIRCEYIEDIAEILSARRRSIILGANICEVVVSNQRFFLIYTIRLIRKISHSTHSIRRSNHKRRPLFRLYIYSICRLSRVATTAAAQ